MMKYVEELPVFSRYQIITHRIKTVMNIHKEVLSM